MSGLFSPSKNKATSTSSILLAPEQKEILSSAMPYIKDFAKEGITLPTGSSIAPYNPTQVGAQEKILGNVDKIQSGADAGLNASNMTLSPDILNPNSNPALQGTIDAAARPLYEGLTRDILPGIRGGAMQSGNIGSSRQGIAEGLATQGTQNAVGDASSRIAYQGYQSGLDTMLKSLGLLPQTLGSQNLAGQTQGAVGDANQAMQQALLDEAKAQFLQKQTLPLQVGKELINLVGAVPSAGASATQVTPGPSLFQSLLGTAATAAGAYFGA